MPLDDGESARGEGLEPSTMGPEHIVLPSTPSPKDCSPDRIRTGVSGLKTKRPRPLDDGAVNIKDKVF